MSKVAKQVEGRYKFIILECIVSNTEEKNENNYSIQNFFYLVCFLNLKKAKAVHEGRPMIINT